VITLVLSITKSSIHYCKDACMLRENFFLIKKFNPGQVTCFQVSSETVSDTQALFLRPSLISPEPRSAGIDFRIQRVNQPSSIRQHLQRFICHYHLFSRNVQLKKANSERTCLCFNTAFGTTHEDYVHYRCRRHKFGMKTMLSNSQYFYTDYSSV